MSRRLVVGLTVIVACSLMAVVLAAGQTHNEEPVAETAQASEGDQRYAILEAMLRDLREELRELKNAAIEESRRIVRRGLDDTRRLLNEIRIEIEPGKAGEHYTVHTSSKGTVYQQALSAGLVTVTATTGGAGACHLQGHVSTDPLNLDPPVDNRFLRGVSSLQYAPGNHGMHNMPPEEVHPYIPLGSITFPVREGEFWTVTGCNATSRWGAKQTRTIKFYALKLKMSGQ